MSNYSSVLNAFVEDTCVLAVVAYILARGQILTMLMGKHLAWRVVFLLGTVLGSFGLTEIIIPGARYPYVTHTLIITFALMIGDLRIGLVAIVAVLAGALFFQGQSQYIDVVLMMAVCGICSYFVRKLFMDRNTLLRGLVGGTVVQTGVALMHYFSAKEFFISNSLVHSLISIPANGFGVMLLQLILNEAQLRSDSERHKLEAERAHSLVVEAQLSALRSRINPHFLFNAHTAIAALCSIAPSKAEAAILRLSQMMRRTLEAKSDESLNFEEELEYVRAYLEIEQLRFEDHLSVVWEIDPKIRNLRLPAFTLQTLVENAVRHGIAPKLGAGEIRIIVRTSHYGTMIAVLDNGAGMTPARRVAALAVNERPEHGLQITTLQLTLLYGDRARVRLFSQEEIGTMAALLIPYPSGGKKYGSKK